MAPCVRPVRLGSRRRWGPGCSAPSRWQRWADGVGRGRDLVVTDPGGYRVAAERIDLDLDRFDERITAAGKAGTRMAASC